jgi:sec-independent protein translocase protein TatB
VLNFSPEKLFLVGVIALIVLGPNRLPQAARSLGRFAAAVRRMSSGFQDEVRSALAEPTQMVNSAVSEFKVPNVRQSVRDAVSSTLTTPESRPTTVNPPLGTPDEPTLN